SEPGVGEYDVPAGADLPCVRAEPPQFDRLPLGWSCCRGSGCCRLAAGGRADHASRSDRGRACEHSSATQPHAVSSRRTWVLSQGEGAGGCRICSCACSDCLEISPQVSWVMLTERHLQIFIALAEEQHFGDAARAVGITQPPLSQGLRRLEALVGAKLFERGQGRVE